MTTLSYNHVALVLLNQNMATLVRNTTAKAIGNYVGETKKQIRDGFGVYNYPNQFFRYEGEWKDGIKHGHGRLLMSDGSFYEGSFFNGEITGHGYRVWSRTNNSYTGQFERGELCGHGVMVYGNGDRYEGGWQENKREGDGRLSETNGDTYKGSFHQHKRHGEGSQIYGNGDKYNGGWVIGKKQGHGTMTYADGTIYEGQWRDDTFNGEGSMVHASGMMYTGMWNCGRPAAEAFSLSVNGSNVIEVAQGKAFKVEVFCETVDGDRTQDEGRLLQVTAGIKQVNNKRFLLDERQHEQAVFSTPFDFEAEPYPITVVPPAESEQSGYGPPPSPIMESNETSLEQDCKNQSVDHVAMDSSPPPTVAGPPSESLHHSPMVATDNEGTSEGITNASQGFLFPLVPLLRTMNGQATFEHLYLPSGDTGQLRTSSSTFEDVTEQSKASQGQKVKRGTGGGKKGSVQHSATDVADTKEGKRRKERKEEKYNDEKMKFCKPGDYIIIVKDVTSPPFLGTTLQPAYLHVKVTPKQRRAKSKMDRK